MGDTVAYGMLLDELYGVLKSYLGAKVKVEADDVLQDVLLTVHKIRHTYDPSRPFLPWLFAVAQHRAQDSQRQAWRRYRRSDALKEEALTKPGFVEGGTTDLEDALRALPERQRVVVTMLKLEGFSIKEIAARLALSTGAVKVIAHRAYEALRSKLTELPDEL